VRDTTELVLEVAVKLLVLSNSLEMALVEESWDPVLLDEKVELVVEARELLLRLDEVVIEDELSVADEVDPTLLHVGGMEDWDDVLALVDDANQEYAPEVDVDALLELEEWIAIDDDDDPVEDG
jgi:hypothetical protein